MNGTLVVFNMDSHRPEKEFDNFSDAARYIIHRNSATIGARVKKNGNVVMVAGARDMELFIGDNHNPVDRVLLVGYYRLSFELIVTADHIKIGNIAGIRIENQHSTSKGDDA